MTLAGRTFGGFGTGGAKVQRVYLWQVDPDTGRGRIIDDHGGDLDRMSRYVDDWLVDASGQPIARAAYSYLDETLRGYFL